MSKIIKELKSDLTTCIYSIDDSYDGKYSMECILDKLNSLGTNAQRMLEIGIVQDKLVELGFGFFADSVSIFANDSQTIMLSFCKRTVEIWDYQKSKDEDRKSVCYYTSPTWQDDLIAKVEDLIKSAQPLD